MRPDYDQLIDSETWDFIRETDRWYPPDAITLSIAKQREIYDRMCRGFFTGYPKGVSASDQTADGVPVRWYKNASPAPATVLYLHGGGFVVGGLESHDDVCADICDQTGFDVVSVDYRLAPEHTHPAAFTDCVTVFNWLQYRNKSPLVLVGDSAGGTLAAATAHATRQHQNPASGMVLIYPGLAADAGSASFTTHANAPMLTAADCVFYRDIVTGGTDRSTDPTLHPLADTDFTNLPACAIFSAECDPLCDDGARYAKAIIAAKGTAQWTSEKGLVHGYLRARRNVAKARDSFSRIIATIESLAKREIP
ncbi:MAG: alpha/beta hydrolase [Rhodobacteraceae bacterium]|nr:alpha/beta hydrolase [Paracoccaceae bacterium]